MAYYRLSEQRVKSVLHSPKRIEEGVAPRTIAVMSPASIKYVVPKTGGVRKEAWSQEIWVMVQDAPTGRKVISAWRYPGVSKVRGEVTDMMRAEYQSYLSKK
jgi:hypothetical protein